MLIPLCPYFLSFIESRDARIRDLERVVKMQKDLREIETRRHERDVIALKRIAKSVGKECKKLQKRHRHMRHRVCALEAKLNRNARIDRFKAMVTIFDDARKVRQSK